MKALTAEKINFNKSKEHKLNGPFELVNGETFKNSEIFPYYIDLPKPKNITKN